MNESTTKEESLREDVTTETTEAVSSNGNDPATETDSQAEADASPSLEEQLEQAQREAKENLDRWQRSVAELANFKRRQEEMRKVERNQIKNQVLQGVISSLDDIDLAFQNLPEGLDGQVTGWVEGFRLVQRKLNKILDDQFVTPIDTSGQFDPTLHEAVSYEESPDHEEGQIIAELRKGYQAGSHVIRPALVRVAS